MTKMNFCFEVAAGPVNKLIQLKDANGNLLYPKVLSKSIPAGAVSKAQLGADVTDILDGVATDTNLKSVQDKVTAIEGKVTTLNGDKTVAGSVDKKVADAISALVGTAPDTLNTLQKIAEEMQNPANNTATTVLDQVASKADSSALADEVTRAKAAEKANADAIAANTKSISDEVTRAKAAEKTNADNITAEVTRAKAAEKSNSNAIEAINAKLLTPMITYEEVTA
jgi:hypothetical protein